VVLFTAFCEAWILDPRSQMQVDRLKRREFIVELGGAVAWPIAARAG
jgi:hypothetical protein